MVHQPRRRSARGAAVLLGLVVLLGTMIGRVASPVHPGPAARADVTLAPQPGPKLDLRTAPVVSALHRDRAAEHLPRLTLDAELMAGAATDACAIARGEVPLTGDPERMRNGGAELENVGMVLDDDPLAGARTMHDWWAHTRQQRVNRMDRDMVRYGIGACTVENRTYYVERFAR